MITLNLIYKDGSEVITTVPISTSFVGLTKLMNNNVVESYEVIGVIYD